MNNYSKKHNTFFVHIPKNAGTSMHQALGVQPKLRGHKTAQRLRELYNNFDECESIAIVRNPFDRMVSLFEFRVRGANKSKNKNFNRWIAAQLVAKKKLSMDYMNNLDCIHDGGKYLVKHVLRYENLQEDYAKLSRDVYSGTLPPLPKLNITVKKDYRTYYNDASKELVRTWFDKDIKEFNYEF